MAPTVAKDYQKIEARRNELAAANRKREEMKNYPLRYQLLECRPGVPLALAKLKYLVACRRTHPEAGGDAEDFLRVSLAYQDVLKDYGVETVDNQVVNLGNYQTGDHEAQNYLTARANVQSYIPISTLEDHIKQIEAVKARLGDHLSEKLSSSSDEAMWLLEDIEDIMEQTGLKTVKLQVLDDGKVLAKESAQLTDGTEKPLFLPKDVADAAEKARQEERKATDRAADAAEGNAAETISADSARAENADSASYSSSSQTGDGADNESKTCASEDKSAPHSAQEVEVSARDIEVLNAKHALEDRTDIAGLASRTATEVMNNTEEVKDIKVGLVILFTLASGIFFSYYTYLSAKGRAEKQAKDRPQLTEHITTDTMLPWWGNDAEYESQVKRIFVEEWRRARASARRTQTFQDGVARESLDDDTKKEMDLKIFTVTAERLRAMRENAEHHATR